MKSAADVLKAYASINNAELGEDKFDGHYNRNQALTTLCKDILEIIGEAEKSPPKPHDMPQSEYMDYKSNMWARNDLRQEQREAIKTYFGRKSE